MKRLNAHSAVIFNLKLTVPVREAFKICPCREKVIIKIKNRKMFCNNVECKHTTFAERFSWLADKSKKTRSLEEEIVRLSLNCSSNAAARFLSENSVSVSKSTICNLLKKTYHNSIIEAHPKAIQISDRFHLYKTLTDYAIEYLKKHLKKMVKIVIDCKGKISPILPSISKDNENRKLTLEEKYHKILLLQREKRSQTEICRAVNMDDRCYKKLMTISTIRHYASEWKKRFKENIKESEVEEGKEIITMKRTDIFKALFRPISHIKSLEEDKFQRFCDQYPFFKIILELINSFREIFEQKKPKLLREWIDKAKNTKIKEIISFANGIERDYDAVENAVCLPYSNGLAEGTVNKIKVIKKVMYARCSFETLRNKIIRLDRINKFN